MGKRILLTGGGSGGHIYPLLAVAEQLKKIASQDTELFYFGPQSPLNEEFDRLDIPVYQIASSKLRRYFSLSNFVDIPKFFWGILQAFRRLYSLMPDVVFSKGGPGALPVIIAARFYFIPVIIHESDAVPGLTNRLSAKLAKRIGISFQGAINYFPRAKTALIGNPIRSGIIASLNLTSRQAKTSLHFDPNKPLILILGGSQGSERINNFVFENLPELLKLGQIYHQVGDLNLKNADENRRTMIVEAKSVEEEYRLTGFFDIAGLREVFAAADLVISRAGAGAIFEIAAFGKPSILVPLQESANGHQRANAYEYAKSGAAGVIEEANFTINILKTQIQSILDNPEKMGDMIIAAHEFAKPEAADILAKEIVKLSLGKA